MMELPKGYLETQKIEPTFRSVDCCMICGYLEVKGVSAMFAGKCTKMGGELVWVSGCCDHFRVVVPKQPDKPAE